MKGEPDTPHGNPRVGTSEIFISSRIWFSRRFQNLPVPFRSKYTAADVLAMELPVEVPTLNGHAIKIDKTTDGDVLVAGNKVVAPDIEASNGVIHGIDGVITEVTKEPEE